MENLELNYQELAYIMDLKTVEAKDLFLKILNQEKVKTKETISVSVLKDHFENIKSLDARYDGQNKLIFNLNHKSRNYKKFLSVKGMVKVKKFTAGKTVFYKICSKEQLAHAKEAFTFNNKVMFPLDNEN